MNQPPLKIISLNTQRGIFLEKIISFFQSESPDILCLQEIYQHDFEHIQQTLGLQGVFTPGVIFESQKYAGPVVEGVGILTHHPIIEQHIHTYTNNKGELSVISDNHAPEKHLKSSENIEYTKQRNIVCITIQIEEVTHTCATTHFTWGYYGYIDTENKQFIWQPNTESVQRQKHDMDSMLTYLQTFPEMIFAGDTNCPRSTEIFSMLADRYTDHIPKEYTTSIDGNHHRAGALPLMVDGLFTTPHYRATDVAFIGDLSDHFAVRALVHKTNN